MKKKKEFFYSFVIEKAGWRIHASIEASCSSERIGWFLTYRWHTKHVRVYKLS